jgi:hypothetical protein
MYSMSVFLLLNVLCSEINSQMQRLWWGHQANESKVHWISCERMGRSKKIEIRNLLENTWHWDVPDCYPGLEHSALVG